MTRKRNGGNGISSILTGSLVCLGLLAGPSQSSAQFVDLSQRTHPILSPVSDAPTAVVRALAFGTDAQGHHVLYAAGDDKVVRQWTLLEQPDGTVRLEPAGRTLWPIYRAIRGVIYALDVHSTGQSNLLAFGGIGAKPSQVNLVDTASPNAPRVLISNEVLGRNAVYTLDISPTGQMLAVGYDQTPKVMIFLMAANVSVPLTTGFNTVQRVGFNSAGNQLAVAGVDKSGAWAVEIWDPVKSTRLSRTALPANARVTGLAWSGANQWLAATRLGVFDASGQNLIAAGGAGRSIASIIPLTGAGGYLLAESKTDGTTAGLFWGNTVDAQRYAHISMSGTEVAMQASADGRYLAVAGLVPMQGLPTPVHAVQVYNAVTGRLVGQVPDLATAQAANASIVNVSLTGDPLNKRNDEIGIGIAWGTFRADTSPLPPIQRYMRMLSREMVAAGSGSSQGIKQRTRTFQVIPKDNQEIYYLVLSNQDFWGPLPVWGNRRPVCYDANESLGLLAVGYGDGFVICDLNRLTARQALQNFSKSAAEQMSIADRSILRSFYGHTGPVTCFDFDPQGKWLITGSVDGTVCGWNLDNVRSGRGELGVETRLANLGGRTVLEVSKDPELGSPGWEAGFKQGQLIRSIQVAGVVVSPAQWQQTLAAPIPGKELLVEVSFQGKNLGLISTVSHDPLWTLLPRLDSSWTLWTPNGYFEVPSPNDIDRLEWHLNFGGDAAVQQEDKGALRLPASDFKDLYQNASYVVDSQRNQLIRDAQGNLIVHTPANPYPPLSDSSKGLREFSLLDYHITTRRPEEPRNLPIPPSINLTYNPSTQQVTLVATPNGPEAIAEVELRLNGMLLSTSAQQRQVSLRLDPNLLRQGRNLLVGVASLKVGRGHVYSRTVSQVAGPKLTAPPARRLHYLGIGVTYLAGMGQTLKSLQFPGHDARELATALESLTVGKPGGANANNWQAGRFKVLSGVDIDPINFAPVAGTPPQGHVAPTEGNVRAALADLATGIRPDDLVVVLLAGHGVASKDSGFRFICEDSAAPPQGGLTDVEIQTALSKLPCRTLLLMDACHSDAVNLDQVLQDWPGFGLGPLILSGCGKESQSLEHVRLGIPGHSQGHGMFTASLLEPLYGVRAESRILDDPPAVRGNKQGELTLAAWCDYARVRTPMLGRLHGRTDQLPKLTHSVTFVDAEDLVLAPARPIAKQPAAGGQAVGNE